MEPANIKTTICLRMTRIPHSVRLPVCRTFVLGTFTVWPRVLATPDKRFTSVVPRRPYR
jgi:hypothetical protein